MMSTNRPTTATTTTLGLAIAVLQILLSGCVATTLHSSTLALKSVPRSELRPNAEAGDAVAQYKLGRSYCCMGPGFDTNTATHWYCESAKQGNSDAMYELGRVYSGDVSRTPAPGQKLRRHLIPKSSPAHAYLWLHRASLLEHSGAQEKLSKLSARINTEDLAIAQQFVNDWRNVDCEYNDVFAKQ